MLAASRKRAAVAAAVAAAVVVLPPLAWLAFHGSLSLASRGPAPPDAIARGLLARSLAIAGGTTAVALALGVPFGWLTARHRLFARETLLWGSLLPALLPSYAAAFAWSLLLGREGPVAVILAACGWRGTVPATYGSPLLAVWVLGSTVWPIVAWFTIAAARSVPTELEDAAREHLPPGAAALFAARPVLHGSVFAAVLLVFLIALADFAAPSALGVATYPVEIVTRFQMDRNPAMTARLAVPLLLVVVPLVACHRRLLATALPAAPATAPRLLPPPHWAAPFCALTLVFTAALPLAQLFAASFPLRTYLYVFRESGDHLINTAITAGSAACLATALALWQVWSGRGRTPALLEVPLSVGYAVPGSLVGVAMIQLLNRPGPVGWLYTSMAGLAWTYVALFYAFALRSIASGLPAVDADLVDDARLCGASAWTQLRVAAWPALRSRVLLGGTLVALLASREVDATGLLRIPGGDTIAFRIHDYLHFSPTPQVAALCVLLTAGGATVGGLVVRAVLRRDRATWYALQCAGECSAGNPTAGRPRRRRSRRASTMPG